MNNLENFGIYLFSDEVMKERIPNSTYRAFHQSLDENKPLSKDTATVIANAMKIWAMEKGATHFTHWFTPMTGLSAEKHDAFLEIDQHGRPLFEFSGKALRKGESDASSFPSGGLRATFEARGYTSWDATSPAFVKDGSLYIPTVFVSYNGQALDKKTPLLKSYDALNRHMRELLNVLGMEDVKSVKACVGVEQEYFLVREEDYQKRIDLKLCGRTLFGAKPPKGQEMEDHYYGNIKMKVADFMADLDKELWKYGIPAKTKHNEAAPSQHEIACIYRDVNITTDNNQLLMSLIQDVAKKHGLHCLLHEKPYAYINGSGKHNNYSLLTDTGVNIFNPGPNPESNIPFLAAVACMVKGVDEFADLLRVSTASATNDLRLGGNEAPPAIVSMFLGEDISDLFTGLTSGNFKPANKERFHTGVKVSSDFSKDATDRNRTSPLAFTGNKFEFRMVGSNQCVAGPNTMLNAILAYEAKKMTQAIKDGGQVMDVILSFYNEHKRIVFNGDGYSDMWRNEALKRGLKERQNTYEAAFAYLDAPNVAMLTEMGIYTEEELKSRFEIILENYAKTVRIEASTALLMAKTEIYPAVLNELKDKGELLNNLHNLSINDSYIFDDLQNYNALIAALKADIDSLQADLNKYNELTSIKDKAAFAVEKLNKDLAQIRNSADLLEDETAKNKWPIPNYVDLIFAL